MLKQLPVQPTKLTDAEATDTTNSKIICFPVNKSTNSEIIKNISPKQDENKIIHLKNSTNEANTEDFKSLKKYVSLALNDTEVCFLFMNDRNINFTTGFRTKQIKKKLKNFSITFF